MTRSLTVVHVVLSLDVGGLERIVVDLVREGQRTGQRAAVVCLERRGTLAPQVEAVGAVVVSVKKLPGVRLGTIQQLRCVLAELRPDVVHTHQMGALFYAGLAAAGLGVPVVHTEHGLHSYESLRTRLLSCVAGRLAARFVCVSRAIAAAVIRNHVAPRRRVRVIPNGIDLAPFRPTGDGRALRRTLGIPLDAPVIGTIGRLAEVKQQDLLIRAFARLRQHITDAHLVLVGDGPQRDFLQQLSNKLGLADCIHFTGYQERPQDYLRAMTAFALSSRSEGMPLVVLEAWTAGLPVVATRVGGVPEMIRHEQTGLLVPAGDERALAAALRRLLDDATLARALAAAGREQVEKNFTLAAMARSYEQHYRELLGRPESSAGRSSSTFRSERKGARRAYFGFHQLVSQSARPRPGAVQPESIPRLGGSASGRRDRSRVLDRRASRPLANGLPASR